MSNYSHATLTHSRAEKRQGYVRAYLCVTADQHATIIDTDGHVLAWSDWDRAKRHADRRGMIVVNWTWFITHSLPQLPIIPPAVRLTATSKHGEEKRFHVELDASEEELRTLNSFMDWEYAHHPLKVSDRLKHAKVWQEGQS